MSTSSRHAVAAVSLVLATPVAAWWAEGDQSEPASSSLNYMIRPPHISPAVATAVGVLATVVVVVTAVVLGWARHRRRISNEWLVTPVLLSAAGSVLALGWRTLTAGVIGANIGGGLFLLVGPPAAVGLVVAAIACAGRERAARRA